MTLPGSATRSPMVGVSMTIVATALFCTLDTSMQYVANTIPLVMALWLRYLIQTVLTTIAVFKIEKQVFPHANEPGLQLFRGAMFVLLSVFAFFSLRHISVGEFTAILMLTPVVVSVVSALLFREKVKRIRWLLLLISFAGTLVIVRPGGHGFSWALLFPLGCLAANTCFLVVTAKLSSRDNPLSTHFYSGLFGTVLLSLLLPWSWSTAAPATMWAVLGIGATAASLGHMLLVSAYRHASASVLTPFLYIQLLFATISGWVFFDRVPDAMVFLGIFLIAFSGMIGGWLTKKEQNSSH